MPPVCPSDEEFQMAFRGAAEHLARVRLQLGKPVIVNKKPFKCRGYFANRLALNLAHEPHLVPVVRRIMAERAGPVIDVGANLGQTLAKVLAVDSNREYVGFEPQIACCFFLDQFLKDNGLSNCTVLPIALSETNGVKIMYSGDPYDEMASLNSQHVCSHEFEQRSFVPVRNGDEVFAELGLRDAALVKVDVEGAELAVFLGLQRVLATHRPVLIFEVLPNFEGIERARIDEVTAKCNRARAEEIHQLLSKLDYHVMQIDRDGDEIPIERFDLDHADNYVGSDYIARPLR
jgi:FkbM family methyltransferase